MTNARLGWKAAAILLSIIATAAFAGSAIKGSAVPSAVALLFAALGAIQYAFGWPRIPRIAWRIFGPIFSLLMAWSVASKVGWLATRLIIIRLTLGEQAVTLGALLITAGFGLIVSVPLYRLGDWSNSQQARERERLAELGDTFA
jgi:hypothetical protein